VGTQSPRVLDDHVLRVRTVSACVEETLALLSAKVPAASVR
ncbi:MAG: helix-turn-helix-type transcriptional regulator, partial [Actinomyces sp.]|nr:helix-turn-helix-type transcriptional regulator [Actinomyces sp.]